jgi:hypothetical protein
MDAASDKCVNLRDFIRHYEANRPKYVMPMADTSIPDATAPAAAGLTELQQQATSDGWQSYHSSHIIQRDLHLLL